MTYSEESNINFSDLKLHKNIISVLHNLEYKKPSPIQAQAIPHVLSGRDILGQAQTGTGKTAAFALPLLSKIDLKKNKPQVLVLVPTRELAIQVSKAFQKYAANMQSLQVLAVYGGQEYGSQLRSLRAGVQIVIGTPGRIIDHIERKSLDLSQLNCLVLDEADEMLRMGFLENVEWILERMPQKRQIALFSATMPREIKKISERYLNDPVHIVVKNKKSVENFIEQYFITTHNKEKFNDLIKILEVEQTAGVIIFVRTKQATVELCEKLDKYGYAVAAINGDIPQKQRESTIEQLKSGKFDLLVATDVAARGLDIDRINHVINYDMPQGIESYIHRIGRTGRAGRKGKAIIFISSRDKRMLSAIERATGKNIKQFAMPSIKEINQIRANKFKQLIIEAAQASNDNILKKIIEECSKEHNLSGLDIAVGLANKLYGNSLLLQQNQNSQEQENKNRNKNKNRFKENNIHNVKKSFKNGKNSKNNKNGKNFKPNKTN